MSSGVTTYGRTALLGQMFGVLPVPAHYYVGLADDQPGEGMDGDIFADLEPPADAGYHRVPIATGATAWTVSGLYLTNLVTVDFGVPLADWGRLDHYGLLDADSGGNLIGYGEILNPELALATFEVALPPGSIIIGLYQLENSINA